MSRKDKDYNWLDDPFNDKVVDPADKKGGTLLAGIGCVVVVVALLVLVVFAFITMLSAASNL